MIFSPPVTPTVYDRGEEQYGEEVRQMEYGEWVMVMSEVSDAYDVARYSDDMILYRGDIGEVFIADDNAHVADSMYRSHPLVFLREYVASAVLDCKRKGVIAELRCTDDTRVYQNE